MKLKEAGVYLKFNETTSTLIKPPELQQNYQKFNKLPELLQNNCNFNKLTGSWKSTKLEYDL